MSSDLTDKAGESLREEIEGNFALHAAVFDFEWRPSRSVSNQLHNNNNWQLIYIKNKLRTEVLAARRMESFFTQIYSTLLSTHMYILEGNGQELTGEGGI